VEPEPKRPGSPGNHKLQTNSKQKEAASLPGAAALNLFDLLSFFFVCFLFIVPLLFACCL
jgi:hypothetical protein